MIDRVGSDVQFLQLVLQEERTRKSLQVENIITFHL